MGANIAVASTIEGNVETGLLTGGNSFTLVNNVKANNQTWMVSSLILSNYDTTTSAGAISQLFNVSTGFLGITPYHYIAFEQAVPPQASVVVIDSTMPIYLKDYQDLILIEALGASTGLHYAITYTVLQS